MSDLKELLGFDPDELEELDDLPSESAERIRREWKATMEKLVAGVERLVERVEHVEQRFEDLRDDLSKPVNITVEPAPSPTIEVNVPKLDQPKIEVKVEAAKVSVPEGPAPVVNVSVPEKKRGARTIKTWRDDEGKLQGRIEDAKE